MEQEEELNICLLRVSKRKRISSVTQSLSINRNRVSVVPTAAVSALAIFCLLPSFGTPFSLPSQTAVPSDPCWEFAKISGGSEECLASNNDVVTDAAACPRYHPGVFDGRVCVGCFRDDYEIAKWESFTFAEKAYALEDACDRIQTAAAAVAEESISVDELKRQASVWRILAETPGVGWDGGTKEESCPIYSDLDSDPVVAADNRSGRAISMSDSVPISKDQPLDAPKTVRKDKGEVAGRNTSSMVELPNAVLPQQQVQSARIENNKTNEAQKEQRSKETQTQTPPPPTPCTRICRYNANCYDGKVCIGCFRDTHDIAQWSGMSPSEKMFSLEDAADRCRELSATGQDTKTVFEGGITEEALRSQASLWGVWKG